MTPDLLIHKADPQSRPVVIIVFAHVVRSYFVRTSFPIFQNKTNFKQKQCSLLARLWVWPTGSLMTPDLFRLMFQKEQICQKQDKRDRTRQYKIVSHYSGSWFPLWSQGFRVACKPPCSDEPRIALNPGDLVNVTRWKK